MRFLVLILTLTTSTLTFAQRCPVDVASYCFQEMRDQGHSYNTSVKFCKDTSNTCYMDYREHNNSVKTSKKSCFNTSNNCYTDVSRKLHFNIKDSARICENVNNNCYVRLRTNKHSIRRSIKACKNKYEDCRVCDLL